MWKSGDHPQTWGWVWLSETDVKDLSGPRHHRGREGGINSLSWWILEKKMEELINSNLWADVGEVHLAQTTVAGTEADTGIRRKRAHLNRVKRSLKGEKPTAGPGSAAGLNLGRKPDSTQGKEDASPW